MTIHVDQSALAGNEGRSNGSFRNTATVWNRSPAATEAITLGPEYSDVDHCHNKSEAVNSIYFGLVTLIKTVCTIKGAGVPAGSI